MSDTIDGFEFYATIEGMVAGNPAFPRVVLAGVIIETANIVELVFDVPAGRTAENRHLPLIELVPTNYPEKADLDAARASLTAADADWIRELRNSIAAHVDSKPRLASLLAKLDGTDARRLNDLFHFVTGALDETDSRHAITVISPMRRLRGAVLSDLRRIDPPEHPASY